jgi:ferric-dicitrate binding protein FerR (iron transport regulator)
VTLAPRTTLIVPRGFVAQTRNVSLVGQARFEVGSFTGAPFTVRTGAITTRVLGTVFDVTRYPTDAAVQVVVSAGKVVTGATRMVTVAAGQIARVTDSTAVASTVSNLRDYTEWTEGRVRFHERPVRDVLATVGRWYGLEFRLSDSTLAGQHITATFSARSTADAIAKLSLLLNASAAVHDTVVTFHTTTQSEIRPARPRRSDLMKPSTLEVGR